MNWSVFVATELQEKYEQQRALRGGAETKLLEVEKTKSELSVDLCQLKLQVSALKTDLHSEIEKVRDWICSGHMLLQNVSVTQC